MKLNYETGLGTGLLIGLFTIIAILMFPRIDTLFLYIYLSICATGLVYFIIGVLFREDDRKTKN